MLELVFFGKQLSAMNATDTFTTRAKKMKIPFCRSFFSSSFRQLLKKVEQTTRKVLFLTFTSEQFQAAFFSLEKVSSWGVGQRSTEEALLLLTRSLGIDSWHYKNFSLDVDEIY